MIENAEGGGNPDDPEDGEAVIQHHAKRAGNQKRDNSGADTRGNQEQCCDRHTDEELHLMMEESAVVEEADDREQRGSRKNADNLLLGRSVQREQDGQDEAEIHADPAEQRDRLEMDFARAGLVDHSIEQGIVAHGDGEAE